MTANTDPQSPGSTSDPIRILREIVDGGRTGSVEWPSLAEAGPLVFREGRLLLRKESALALRGRSPGQPAPGSDTLGALENPAESQLLRILAEKLAHPRGPASFREGPPAAGEKLVGPLHPRPLIMEGSVTGRSEAELLMSLGGEDARLHAVAESPAFRALARYPGPLRRLVSRLAEPTTVGDLLRLASSPRPAVLADLRRLQAVGLVEVLSADRPARRTSDSGERHLVDREVLSRFHERIARSLEDRPLQMETEAHRARVVEMLRDGGGDTHYTLLGLPENASAEEIAAAYEELARIVHPHHGEQVGLPGGTEVLGALFERVTQAYRTLSDPDRRRTYDLETGAGASPLRDISDEEMQRVRTRMAASSYRRARENLDQEDFHYAVELMRDAVRWDPQARYWSLLGQAQLPNPKWAERALESFQEAIQLEPGEMKYRLQLAQALESLGRPEAALEEYRKILEITPDVAAAREAVERIEARQQAESPGMMDRLLGWLGLSD